MTLTSVALERKYQLGDIIDQCTEWLDSIEVSLDSYFPYAQHGALLYSVVQRTNLLSKKNYQFSIEMIEQLIDQLFPLTKSQPFEEKDLWKDIDDKGKSQCFVYR